jgi:cytochrome c-type biogenesis protein
MLDFLDSRLYSLAHWSDQQVSTALMSLSPLTLGVVAIAGLLTSLTPCMLSMLPITLAYIGGYEADSRRSAALQSIWFALGLACTLTLLGLTAALLGGIYGQVGRGLPLVVAAIAILMGLNLLELLPLRLPNLDAAALIPVHWPRSLRSFLLGLSFGLVASPCSTPVLATLLAWVSQGGHAAGGALVLLTYALGYCSPLVLAGCFVGQVKQLLELRRWSAWITPASGVSLVLFGLFTLITRMPLTA